METAPLLCTTQSMVIYLLHCIASGLYYCYDCYSLLLLLYPVRIAAAGYQYRTNTITYAR